MKLNLIPLLLTLLSLIFTTQTRAQEQNILIHGTITWASDNSPAASMKVRLLANGTEKAVTYSDSKGTYGILDIPGNPADYTIEIEYRGKILKTLKSDDLKATSRGTRLDIKLD